MGSADSTLRAPDGWQGRRGGGYVLVSPSRTGGCFLSSSQRLAGACLMLVKNYNWMPRETTLGYEMQNEGLVTSTENGLKGLF